MRLTRIAAALILTVGLLYVASTTSRGRPKFVTHTEGGFTFELETVPKGTENSLIRIPITINGNMTGGSRPAFRQSKPGQDETTDMRLYRSIPLHIEDSAAGVYYTEVSTGARGGRCYYYFEIRDNTGGRRAMFADSDGSPFLLKYIGEVPSFIVVTHVTLIFASVFFITLAGAHSIPLIRQGSRDVRPMARHFLLAAVCAFLGAYPFGIPMNWYAFGTTWEGVPFGTDATDNKTQLLFVYLVFMVLATLRTLLSGRKGWDIYSPKTLGWFGVAAFFLMLATYLIPHSIQFSLNLTYVVCYSFIGLVALLYLVGLASGKRRQDEAHTPK